MKIMQFRRPVEVSIRARDASPPMSRERVRVGTTVEPGGGSVSVAPPPPPQPGMPTSSFAKDHPTLNKAAVTLGGASYPVEVSAATAAGAVLGFFFGGPLWGLIAAAGANVAGRFGAGKQCDATGADKGKCQQKAQ